MPVNVIKPSAHIIDDIDGKAILRKLQKHGRNCYKSEDLITDDSAEKFVKMLIERNHLSVLEHVSISVKFIVDRGVSHELVRHRLASFSQECLAGDTVIQKNLTIKQLFDRKQNCYGKTHNKTLWLKSIDENNNVIPNKIIDVFYKGKQGVYEVITDTMKYKIKTTLNHEFFTPKGFKKLNELKVNDSIYVNGRPSLVKISEDQIKKMYLEDKMDVHEIAFACGVKYRNVFNLLHKMKIFKKHLNNKNKEKYTKNHTLNSYTKASQILKEQYKNGRIVWNKGIKAQDDERVKRGSLAIATYRHYKNPSGEKCSTYVDGSSLYRNKKKEINFCEYCKRENLDLEVHHLDKNRKNSNIENLKKLCTKCHKLFHKKNWLLGTIACLEKIKEINYVGIEDTYDLEMKAPYNNYIANGFVVHNSTRYCNYSKRKFNSEITVIDIASHFKNEESKNVWKNAMQYTAKAYDILIKNGESAQIARSVLTNSLKTEVDVTCNLREWLLIFSQRSSAAAHPQMRKVIIPLIKEFQSKIPVIFDNFIFN